MKEIHRDEITKKYKGKLVYIKSDCLNEEFIGIIDVSGGFISKEIKLIQDKSWVVHSAHYDFAIGDRIFLITEEEEQGLLL